MIELTLTDEDFDPEEVIPGSPCRCIFGHSLNSRSSEKDSLVYAPEEVHVGDKVYQIYSCTSAAKIMNELDEWVDKYREIPEEYVKFMQDMKSKYSGAEFTLLERDD